MYFIESNSTKNIYIYIIIIYYIFPATVWYFSKNKYNKDLCAKLNGIFKKPT